MAHTIDVVKDVLQTVDFTIKECAGGYLVTSTDECTDGEDNTWTGAHVFTTEEQVLGFLGLRMRRLKTTRSRFEFEKGQDDYEGSGDQPVKPPRIRSAL